MFFIEKTSEFDKWFRRLKDRKAKANILLRIQRIEAGNLGDVNPVGEGIGEIKIHYGPGYRLYYKINGKQFILLLHGGDKSSQEKDILKAKSIWNQYKKE